MVLIRKLLLDAQAKFRKMVEDNKQLAAKIDGSINLANKEVDTLRAELVDTNKRLMDIHNAANERKDQGVQVSSDGTLTARQKTDEENELIQLREENTRLRAQLRETEELKLAKMSNSEHPSYGELKLNMIQIKQELNRAKEALTAMKADRKRLKGEKLELLNQIKQLYGTLEDKEAELRDFMCTYEQRMRENDESIKQLVTEKEDSDRQRWEIIRRAQDAVKKVVLLQTQNDAQEQHIRKQEAELVMLKEHLSSNGTRLSFDFPDTPKSMESATTSDDLPPYETPPSSANHTSKEEYFKVPSSTPKNDDNCERKGSLTPLMQLLENDPVHKTSHDTSIDSKKKKRISLGSISKMFTRGRSRRSLALPPEEDELPAITRITLLNPDNYQEKLKLVEQSNTSHVTTWKANHVLAWLEIVLNMPMYGKKCAANIKSGKVLLGLSDFELASALDIKNPMHRKKLRLAIEELRNPQQCSYPKASQLDHSWVADKWISDLGLPQYKSVFENNLVDGRMLSHLSRKDMEKYFGIHRKFHQASIHHAVELLHRLGCDKEVLNERRAKCMSTDTDPLVWTNQRVITWVENIDLEEFASNLKESGVHGALMVLEPSFTADTFATALGIPPSKCFLRRHLASELESLIKPARSALSVVTLRKGSLGRSSQRNSVSDTFSSNKSKHSLRGSIGRAFGRKAKDELISKDFWDDAALLPGNKTEKTNNSKQRTSAPITLDEIPDPIKELDAALEQVT
ncbi:hypothetical protein ACJMK2_007193 [Sinanodonta woodiana]|uniref:SAM domain-containing protein n=1 Tax=Sinanodonta woodiana TaxID=1069815 RepID=A0ABD3VHT2_SINWO